MSQKLQTPPRWSPSSFSPPSFSTLPFNSGNKVGAGFGTGYCDAQCPHDVKYINGEPNSQVEMAMVMVYLFGDGDDDNDKQAKSKKMIF